MAPIGPRILNGNFQKLFNELLLMMNGAHNRRGTNIFMPFTSGENYKLFQYQVETSPLGVGPTNNWWKYQICSDQPVKTNEFMYFMN